MYLHGGQNKNSHQPLFKDPMPKPESFVETSTRVLQAAAKPPARVAQSNPLPGAGGPRSTTRSGRAAGEGEKQRDSAGLPLASSVPLSSSERAWLGARRLDRGVQAGAAAASSAGARPRGEQPVVVRWRSHVVLQAQRGVGYVGEKVQIRGRLQLDRGAPMGSRSLEIWLTELRRPWVGTKLGTVMSEPGGMFAIQVHIPLDSKLATYELIARFVGDEHVAPSDSSKGHGGKNTRWAPR